MENWRDNNTFIYMKKLTKEEQKNEVEQEAHRAEAEYQQQQENEAQYEQDQAFDEQRQYEQEQGPEGE